ncbi:hypothetical protein Ga0074812_107182 [Parafrankia irregularis]|uniref:Uncharacterized protein n=1 Tax=Parafrankia irregularis TaxID=795642 RepID=A0A0S4QP94_9ACTN|nr:hypothetical protein Ga0074812_107182 [Parafrankia irregularis]
MLSTARSAPKVTRIVTDGFSPGRQTTEPGLVSTRVGGETERLRGISWSARTP